MTIQASDGPLVTRHASAGQTVLGTSANLNPQQGPNIWNMGDSLLDPRFPFTYMPGGNITDRTFGWMSTECQTVNAVPSTISTVAISASASPGAANPLTLVSTSGAGITVGVTITRADTGVLVTGLLAIDGAQTGINFGQDLQSSYWDPAKALARNIQIASGGNDTGITFTVVGYDVYGYPVTENITGANAGTASGLKAFKYIQSITHTGSVATTVSVGQGDKYGLPLRSDVFPELRVFWDTAWVTANAGYVAAVTTNPATATTGDVRGTYATQSASNGSRRLAIFQAPLSANLNTVTGLTGVTQFPATNNGT